MTRTTAAATASPPSWLGSGRAPAASRTAAPSAFAVASTVGNATLGGGAVGASGRLGARPLLGRCSFGSGLDGGVGVGVGLGGTMLAGAATWARAALWGGSVDRPRGESASWRRASAVVDAAWTRTLGPVPEIQREGLGVRVGTPRAFTRSTRCCTSSSATSRPLTSASQAR
jgi:hypothetical protein